MSRTVSIELAAAAPDKPAVGAKCNGCGVCCAAELCPLGIVIYRRVAGPCPALIWDGPPGNYRCGVLVRPTGLVRHLPKSWVARWIAAGLGCDSDAKVTPG